MVYKQGRNLKYPLIVDGEDGCIRPADIFPHRSHAADHDLEPASAAHLLQTLHVDGLLETVVLPPPVQVVHSDGLHHPIEGISVTHGAA